MLRFGLSIVLKCWAVAHVPIRNRRETPDTIEDRWVDTEQEKNPRLRQRAVIFLDHPNDVRSFARLNTTVESRQCRETAREAGHGGRFFNFPQRVDIIQFMWVKNMKQFGAFFTFQNFSKHILKLSVCDSTALGLLFRGKWKFNNINSTLMHSPCVCKMYSLVHQY